MTQKPILLAIATDELIELVRHSIKLELNTTLVNTMSKTKSLCYYTREETSELLHISLTTLDNYTDRGLIKAVHIGHRILYKDIDIESALLILSRK